MFFSAEKWLEESEQMKPSTRRLCAAKKTTKPKPGLSGAPSSWRRGSRLCSQFCSPRLVRNSHIGEVGEQVFVRSYVISLHFSICEDRKEEIHDVVSKFAAIVREGRWLRRIIVKDVREQSPGDFRCLRRRISTGVLQRMRENRDETGIVRRLRTQIGGVLFAGKERSLIRPSTAICLNPFPASAVQCASPQAQLFIPELRVGDFEHDAAHIRFGEVIVTGELQVVQCSIYVKRKWTLRQPAKKR